MAKETVFQEIRHLISQNKLKATIEKLRQFQLDQDILNELFILESRFNQILSNERLGIVALQEKEVALNQLKRSLLDFIDDIEKNKHYFDQNAKLSNPTSKLSFTLIFFFAVVLLASVYFQNYSKKKNVESSNQNMFSALKKRASQDIIDKITIGTPLKFIEENFGSANQINETDGKNELIWELENIQIRVLSSDQKTVNEEISYIIDENSKDNFSFYVVEANHDSIEIPPLGKLTFYYIWNDENFSKHTGYHMDLAQFVARDMTSEGCKPLILMLPYARMWQNEYQYLFSNNRFYLCDEINTCQKDKILNLTIRKIKNDELFEPLFGYEMLQPE